MEGMVEATLSWMGIPPPRLGPVAPHGLVRLAREAYDVGRRLEAEVPP